MAVLEVRDVSGGSWAIEEVFAVVAECPGVPRGAPESLCRCYVPDCWDPGSAKDTQTPWRDLSASGNARERL
jgi:hypothetical protein